VAPKAAAAATPQPVAAVKVKRLQYAVTAAGGNETNRTWGGNRQNFVQYEPMLENLLGKDKETGQIIPQLAVSWEAANDFKDWTFKLRKGVQFHHGWGEFTAKDVLHAAKILCREDSLLSTCLDFPGDPKLRGDAIPWDKIVEIPDPYTIKFHLNRTTSLLTFNLGKQSSEMSVWSSAFWEKEGLKGLDEKGLQGTNTYQYLGRRPGQSIFFEKIPYKHWSGEDPDFQELEISYIPEDASRYAGLLAGEIHVTELPVDLMTDAEKKGLKLLRSRFTSNDLSIFFGGMYFSSDVRDKAAFDPTVPWVDKRVRKAMNLAINRVELGNFLYRDLWSHMYVDGFHPTLEGWDPTWPERYKTAYAYNPEEAKRLLAEAGYGPNNPVKVRALSYASPGESESPTAVEAVTLYWKKVGIDAKIEDLDDGTVASRFVGRKMQHQVWPNVIIYFPIEYYMGVGYTAAGTTKHYTSDPIEALMPRLRQEVNTAKREVIAREIGNILFDEYASMPLFWFPHTVVADPKVVADWVYPGNTVPRLCCPGNAKAAR
jgi:peptide/nickel transport system substrate-binding protein